MQKRALISVSNKDGIVEFAKQLEKLNYEIISTGGTLQTLHNEGVNAIQVEDITNFPEILDGRVKTLHPKIHGGLLAKIDDASHREQLEENDIQPIDLVVVNLYPFKETLQNESSSHEDKIENIDIGGPAMLRASAKNYAHTMTIVDPNDYEMIINKLKENKVTLKTREKLAAKVFQHTAAYDALIANYFNEQIEDFYPEQFTVTYEKIDDLRYGENPHQSASFYKHFDESSYSLPTSEQLHGKKISYNNIQDANAALEIVREYEKPTVVAVKHMNPCGIGSAETIEQAFDKTYAADPISIFGGIVAFNRKIDLPTAKKLNELFLEIVIAPDFSEDALNELKQKENLRILKVNMAERNEAKQKITSVTGGILVQDEDLSSIDVSSFEVVTKRKPTEKEMNDLLFGWKAVKHVKSNAIVLSKNEQTIGIGAGQMNRVGAAKIAIEQAGKKSVESVLASDAFFPMSDTVETAHRAGVTAVIQPGGSKRDQESIDYCNENDIAMIFTNKRHFKH